MYADMKGSSGEGAEEGAERDINHLLCSGALLKCSMWRRRREARSFCAYNAASALNGDDEGGVSLRLWVIMSSVLKREQALKAYWRKKWETIKVKMMQHFGECDKYVTKAG